MATMELFCAAIVGLYVAVKLKRSDARGAFLARMAFLVTAGWLGENTIIHAYGFYQYSPEWSVFIDRVPLMVILVWPMVIHSAWDLARALTTRHVALVGAAIVLADASLIEPIAVQAGLWSWNHPGLFEVPPIGILGWALFAWACLVTFQARRPWAAVIAAPAFAHASLFACWWVFFRWVDGTVAPWPAVTVAWLLSTALAVYAVRSHLSGRLTLSDMLLRMPGALFFFVLLAMHARDLPALIAYAVAFAPPYLAMTPWTSGRSAARHLPAPPDAKP